MRKLSIFFTSAGRRDYLIDYFSRALAGEGLIHVGNSDPLCSAFTVADAHVVTPSIFDPDYIPFLLTYCRRHSIDAIIPLFDLDLPALAAARSQFDAVGVKLVLASTDAVQICNDKLRTIEFLQTNGIRAPRTFLTVPAALQAVAADQVLFPLIVKPRWGMGSIAVMQADDEKELELIEQLVRQRIFNTYLRFESSVEDHSCVLIQEKLDGPEYGLDILNNLSGDFVTTVSKRKLAMRSGETDIAVTEEQPGLFELGRRLSELMKHPGNLDVDVFMIGGEPVVLELNARFGGGYPFTHLAGANFPAALVAWLRGAEPDPSWFCARAGVVGVKSILPKVLITDYSLTQLAPGP